MKRAIYKKQAKAMVRRLDDMIRDANNGGTFRNICAGIDSPVKLKNGDLVTERNVDAFIHERTRVWRDTWIIARAEELRDELQKVVDGEPS
jgi:hypothetical protein